MPSSFLDRQCDQIMAWLGSRPGTRFRPDEVPGENRRLVRDALNELRMAGLLTSVEPGVFMLSRANQRGPR